MYPNFLSALPTNRNVTSPESQSVKASKRRHPSRWRALGLASAATFTALALTVVSASTSSAIATSVGLGQADSFAVLAGAGITNTGDTTINGDIGTFPITTIDGTGTITVNGTNHGGDGVTQGAKIDLVTAYGVAAGQGPTQPISADLASQILLPDVYNSASTLALSGELTLDAQGDPDAVWVFQAGSDLIVGSGASVTLVNGAQACNVFWQVGSSASINTGVAFKGTIMALASITVAGGSTIQGRLLAQTGTVTLDNDTVTRPVCAAAPDTSADGGSGSVPRGTINTGDGSAATDGLLADDGAPVSAAGLFMTLLAVTAVGGMIAAAAVVVVGRARPRRAGGV